MNRPVCFSGSIWYKDLQVLDQNGNLEDEHQRVVVDFNDVGQLVQSAIYCLKARVGSYL